MKFSSISVLSLAALFAPSFVSATVNWNSAAAQTCALDNWSEIKAVVDPNILQTWDFIPAMLKVLLAQSNALNSDHTLVDNPTAAQILAIYTGFPSGVFSPFADNIVQACLDNPTQPESTTSSTSEEQEPTVSSTSDEQEPASSTSDEQDVASSTPDEETGSSSTSEEASSYSSAEESEPSSASVEESESSSASAEESGSSSASAEESGSSSSVESTSTEEEQETATSSAPAATSTDSPKCRPRPAY
ncbi:hypothetical protein GGI23_000269 [Coemansia sp. RSA 2559]|nr:hypothetical protein GGI23_000269 [Coemansia sp. RSA 2559]KAJ2869476.1 hypothetical protein GGI22_000242 [Coemansia erecta]